MSEMPLEGFSVLDLSQGLAGPTAGALLADFGADVVSIEPPGGGSQRKIGEGSVLPNVSRNKRAIVVDLKTEGGTDVVHRLVEEADALIHNNRPGTMERLDCDYETLSSINPALVYCSITGYGESGPYRDRPGIDPLAQAMSGLMWTTGEADRKPSRIGGPTIDVGAGIHAAFAVVTALFHAFRTGEGQKVEASLFDTAASIMGNWYTQYDMTGDVPTRQGHAWGTYAPSGAFETGTKPVYVATPFQAIWENLCAAVDRTDWNEDSRFATNEARLEHREALTEAIEAEFTNYEREALLDRLLEASVPASELQTVEEAAYDTHLHERGTVQRVENVDGEEVVATAAPVRFSETATEIETVSPAVGEDTREVLADYGFSAEEIERLFDAAAVSGD